MPARRWILVPAPRAGSLAPILLAIALLAGLGVAAFAFALAPLSRGPPGADRSRHGGDPAREPAEDRRVEEEVLARVIDHIRVRIAGEQAASRRSVDIVDVTTFHDGLSVKTTIEVKGAVRMRTSS